MNTPAQPLAKTFYDKGKEKLYVEYDPNADPPSTDHYTPYMIPMQIHTIEGTFSTFIPSDFHSVPSVFHDNLCENSTTISVGDYGSCIVLHKSVNLPLLIPFRRVQRSSWVPPHLPPGATKEGNPKSHHMKKNNN